MSRKSSIVQRRSTGESSDSTDGFIWIFDSRHLPHNISGLSFVLGILFTISLTASLLNYGVGLTALFLFGEYLTAALSGRELSLRSFWPKSEAFLLFQAVGWVEWAIYRSVIGTFAAALSKTCLLLVIAAQVLRFIVMLPQLNWIQSHSILGCQRRNASLLYWNCAFQMMMVNPFALGFAIYFRNLLIAPEDKQQQSITRIQLMDGSHSPQNIATYSFLLGSLSGIGLAASYTVHYKGLGYFLLFLGLFHTLEYITTVRFKQNANLSSFLLNHSRDYHLAMAGGLLEFFVELFLAPSLKIFGFMNYFGLLVVVMSQIVRTVAMITAGSNFSHHIADSKEKGHQLVKHGIYSILRHPAYTGFFYWSIGLQLIMGNPVCFIAYVHVLQNFFKSRIEYEEEKLLDFFGTDYEEYMKRTFIFIP